MDYDLILMDIRLPDINGFEITKEIRSFNKTVPIIAQTAIAIDSEKNRCFEVGCNDYISKPISIPKLLYKINDMLKE
jgi:CheY-like chemotaxis protein